MVTGSIYERKGIYYAIVSYYVDGRRKQKSVSTGLPVKGNKRRALEFLENLKRTYETKESMENMDGSRLLMTDYMDEWLKIVKPLVERATYKSYDNMVSARIRPHFEKLNLLLTEVEPKHIKMLYDEILEQGYTTNTVIHYHAVLHQALAYAVKNDYILSNPADRVKRPKKNKHISSFYTKEEILTLLDIAKDDPIYIPIVLSAYYGFRRSETLGMRWSAIDFENKTITVNHKVTELTENGKTIVYAEDKLKTKSSYRTLPLIPVVEEKLLEHKAKLERNQKLFGNGYCKEYMDYVCVDEMGKLFRPNFVSDHFGWLLKKYGLKKLTFKELRHSCASMLVAEGIPMKSIQEWLGHSNFSTTADIYSHIDYHAKQQSAAAIGNALQSKKD
ncbi:site-specific integrase [Anaerotignum lactatifermentans]|uniref:Site-specific recombinase XerD n=1 Tax=Anaerotignum lactatifermentans DSM 14214 TaxID=1121323 RepID=A0A1M6N8F9_9FIRM|nr:site-specific integrase [Anaerotignum lactatifermentans]SHJ91856.1 Site-specific recombinase XerD [[Clostridium] lactatifermentans DSM 14214] [Anaerotignum lactatifermentans DSM 14214]